MTSSCIRYLLRMLLHCKERTRATLNDRGTYQYFATAEPWLSLEGTMTGSLPLQFLLGPHSPRQESRLRTGDLLLSIFTEKIKKQRIRSVQSFNQRKWT